MPDSNKKQLIIAGGGSGGHVFPALAVWEIIKEKYPDVELTWIGSSHRMESRLIPDRGISFRPIRATEIRRGKSAGNFFYNLRSLWYLNQAISECRKIISDIKPVCLLSTGGFAAGAAGLAAGLAKTPLVIIEPNAYPGLTNRKLGPAAQLVFIAFPQAEEYFPKDRTYRYGIPIRKEIIEKSRSDARKQLALDDDTFMILAMGGSQGADSININVPFGTLQIVRESEDIKLRVMHSAGKGRIDEARVFREELTDDMYQVVEFIDDVPTYLAAADLVISRAGASTLAEISARGVPSILFPYPKSAENHQLKNARSWEEAGAAIVLEDGSTNIGDLSSVLIILLHDPEKRTRMGEAARQFGSPEAAEKIAEKLSGFF